MPRRIRQLILLSCLLATSLIVSQPAWAFGQDGHKLICALAYGKLTPAGKTYVDELLLMGEFLDGKKSMAFADACNWPDKAKYGQYKGSYEQHFLNVKPGETRVDLARDCPALNCLATGIQRSLIYLSRPAMGKRESARKAASLRFLGHYIGDLQQPLHVSHAHDWGGSKIAVKFRGRSTNLHRLWDSDLLRQAGISYPASLKLLAAHKPFLETRPDDGWLLEWIQLSYDLALTKAYLDTNGRPIETGHRITNAYFIAAKPILIQQIVLGGERLAFILNQLAAGQIRPQLQLAQ